MALHGVQNPAAVAAYVPRSNLVNQALAGNSAIPQPPIARKQEEEQDSYSLSGNGGPYAHVNGGNPALAAAQGSASPLHGAPSPAVSDAPASTQQAPDAASITGVPTYNYHGQLNAVHPDAGRALRVSA